MDPILQFVVVLVIGIALLVFLLLKMEMHPVIALFLVSAFLGIGLGNGVLPTMNMINSGFGGTLTSIGLTIIFGAIIAMGIQDTGSVTSMCNFFIKLFKGNRLELAPSLTAYIMSIPVFGDITIVLTAPLAAVFARRKGGTMSLYGMMGGLAASITHATAPPTPGPLAVALALGAAADLGFVVFWGCVSGIFALMVPYFVLGKWCKKEQIDPKPEFVTGIERAPEGCSVEELLIDATGCPSTFMAFLPLLIPIVFISAGSFGSMLFGTESAAYAFCAVLGDRAVALFAGVLGSALVGMQNKEFVTRNALINSGKIAADAPEAEIAKKVKETPFFKVVFDLWIGRGLETALLPLLITCMGGALGGILKASPAVAQLGEMIAATSIPGSVVPFIMAAILMTVCGSQTMAMMTTVGLVAPMMDTLGISTVVATLAIGFGSLVGYHMNNSGFWVNSQFYGLNTKQTIKYISLPCALAGLSGFLFVFVMGMIGIV